jgi:GntR family transcriptional regulator
MLKWIIDKKSKIPLYLQLKDLIKYHISTGSLRSNEQLPGVVDLGKDLQINFETVRKAYKELEKEGLLTMKRGLGTFIMGNNMGNPGSHNGGNHGGSQGAAPAFSPKVSSPLDVPEVMKDFVRQLLYLGLDKAAIQAAFFQALEGLSSEDEQSFVIFTECNQLQVTEISEQLRSHLEVRVKGVLLEELKKEIEGASADDKSPLAVITTGFHLNEVRNIVGNLPVKIDFVITNMSPETRRELDVLDKEAHLGFICRDLESIAFYKDMLKAELGLKSELQCCTLEEEAEVKRILNSVSALLVSPPVYEKIRELAPTTLPIFNVFDKVDPMSLRIIKDNVQG